MTPEEAFDVFQNRSNPPAAFDAECEVLLAGPPQEVTVRSPDLRRKQFPCGFVEIRGNTYCSEETVTGGVGSGPTGGAPELG